MSLVRGVHDYASQKLLVLVTSAGVKAVIAYRSPAERDLITDALYGLLKDLDRT